MTDQQLHPTWGPIPDGYPEGNDELERLGARSRNYLSHSDGHWHLGVPTEIDFVPYASTVLERNRRALIDEVARGPIRPRRATRRPAIARLLAWLDANASDRLPIPRLVIGLGAASLAFITYALYVYATS